MKNVGNCLVIGVFIGLAIVTINELRAIRTEMLVLTCIHFVQNGLPPEKCKGWKK